MCVCVCVCVCVFAHARSVAVLSHAQLFATLWTVALQAPLSMELSRQEYWSGLPLPDSGNLPDPGIKPMSLLSPALVDRLFTTSATWEAEVFINCF